MTSERGESQLTIRAAEAYRALCRLEDELDERHPEPITATERRHLEILSSRLAFDSTRKLQRALVPEAL
jgi:hypothetical protein